MRYPYNGERQIRILQPITLGSNSGLTESAAAVEFRVMIPDSRLQVKTSVLFSPTPPFTLPMDITPMAPTLYLAEEDECYGGPFSGFVPLTAIVGTQTAPQTLPQFPRLLGYSQEFVTAADAVHGWFTWQSSGGGTLGGQWLLQVRYQPAGQRLPDKDWEETLQLCNATLVTQPGQT